MRICRFFSKIYHIDAVGLDFFPERVASFSDAADDEVAGNAVLSQHERATTKPVTAKKELLNRLVVVDESKRPFDSSKDIEDGILPERRVRSTCFCEEIVDGLAVVPFDLSTIKTPCLAVPAENCPSVVTHKRLPCEMVAAQGQDGG